jgi:hypothetical protein
MSMAQAISRVRFPRHFLSWLATHLNPRPRGKLDPRLLSGHLQRDIGFLDGRGAARDARAHSPCGR